MSLPNKHLCVHGHFHQPPRENPWHGAVDPEDSAHPYRDWNEKVFEESYGPNSACPLPDKDGRIVAMADNYRRLSFDFSPPLLAWLERERPEAYRRILAADKASANERGGHGNALAGPYYHALLPERSLAEKRLLVRWGLADFRRRFGREPEGFWLPGLAADEETLEVLIEEGLRFTILAPASAARLRTLGEDGAWKDVDEKTLLPTRPYRWNSSSQPDKHIAVFFYHELLSQMVVDGSAFEARDTLLSQTLARYHPDDSTQLVALAVDGENFGHRHRYGHRVLAETFSRFADAGGQLTNFAQLLERLPPPQEVELKPYGAQENKHPGLVEAFSWLSSRCDALYEKSAGTYFKDYRGALSDDFGDPDAFLERNSLRALAPEEQRNALALLEMQRRRLALWTSDGWNQEDLSAPEAAQLLAHAARAAELAETLEPGVLDAFRERLSSVPSGNKRWPDASKLLASLVWPRRADAARAAAHHAILAHLGVAEFSSDYGFPAEAIAATRKTKLGPAGRDRSFSSSLLEIDSRAERRHLELLTVVHQQDRLDLACWALSKPGETGLAQTLGGLFEKLSAPEFERELSSRLGPAAYGLDAVFPAERRELLRLLVPPPSRPADHREFMGRWLEALGRLRRDAGDGEDALQLIETCRERRLTPDQLPWVAEVRDRLPRLFASLRGASSAAPLARALRWVEACESAGLHVSLWRLQSLLWEWREEILARGADTLEREAARALGEKLGFAQAVLIPLTEARTPA